MNRAETLANRPVLAPAARVHVVGLLLLALLLQALSPLLHARLQAVRAALTGERIDVAAFCLPGHAPFAPVGESGKAPLPAAPADCQLCQGNAPPATDLPPLPAAAVPAPLTAAVPAVTPSGARPASFSPAHRPRGPPAV
jgi:hypothetical protein